MTTSRLTIRRERARDWPLLQGLPIAADIGVLSLEILRGPREDLVSAVAEASGVLATSRAFASDVLRLTLAAAGRSVDPSAKLAAYNVERDKLWVTLQREGLAIPAGSRRESRVQYGDGSFGFGGTIDLELVELSKALEITRTVNAVCIGNATLESELVIDHVISSLALPPAVPRSLLQVLIARVNRNEMIVRGYGEFDDRNVGVEVFARDEILARIAESIVERS
jgi:hypothetical protein